MQSPCKVGTEGQPEDITMKLTYQDIEYSRVVKATNQLEAVQKIKPGVLVLVIPKKRPKSVKFLCPCGCGQIISVNLVQETGEAWRIGYDRKHGLSLWPSVWLTSGCCSHFILRHNKARLLLGKIPKMSPTDMDDWLGCSD
jgi:hypothetical protein